MERRPRCFREVEAGAGTASDAMLNSSIVVADDVGDDGWRGKSNSCEWEGKQASEEPNNTYS